MSIFDFKSSISNKNFLFAIFNLKWSILRCWLMKIIANNFWAEKQYLPAANRQYSISVSKTVLVIAWPLFYFISDENRKLVITGLFVNHMFNYHFWIETNHNFSFQIIIMVSVLFMFYFNNFRFKFRNDDFATFPLFRARFFVSLSAWDSENLKMNWRGGRSIYWTWNNWIIMRIDCPYF